MPTRPPIKIVTDDRRAWDRQPGESHRQYSRFRTYLELGRTRTLEQTVETLTAVGDPITKPSLYQIAYSYRWKERVEACDAYQDRLEVDRLIKLRAEMYARHRRLANGLTAAAVRALQSFSDGGLTERGIVAFLRLAADLEAAALGTPQRTVAVSGPDGGPVTVDDLSHLSPQERSTRLAAIAAELLRRSGSGDDDDDG